MSYTNKLKICIKDENFEILHFNTYIKKTQIYTQLVEFTFEHMVSKSMQKLIQHERKVSS